MSMSQITWLPPPTSPLFTLYVIKSQHLLDATLKQTTFHIFWHDIKDASMQKSLALTLVFGGPVLHSCYVQSWLPAFHDMWDDLEHRHQLSVKLDAMGCGSCAEGLSTMI